MPATNITIRMRKQLVAIHASRRNRKAVVYLKEAIARHSKSEVGSVRVSQMLNEYLLANNTNKYKPIKLSFNKGAGIVDVTLQDEAKMAAEKNAKAAAATAAAAPKKMTEQQKKESDKVASEITKQVAGDIAKKAAEKKSPAPKEEKKEAPKKAPAEKRQKETTPAEPQK